MNRTGNKYEIYRKPGWEQAERAIDVAVDKAKEYLSEVYGHGDPLQYAIKTYVLPVLAKLDEFGTTDSDVRFAVEDVLKKHLKALKVLKLAKEFEMDADLQKLADLAGMEVEARFTEGVPADPTKNMSPEDAQKWKDMNEKYKDVVKDMNKSAGEYIEGPGYTSGPPWHYHFTVLGTGKDDPRVARRELEATIKRLGWDRTETHEEISRYASAEATLSKLACGDPLAEMEVMAEGCPDNLDQSECAQWEANTEKYEDKFKAAGDDPLVALEHLAEGCPDNLDGTECKEWEANTEKYKDVVKDQHKAAASLVPLDKAKKGDRVEFDWDGEKLKGKVVRVKTDGTLTIDVENPSDEDMGWVDIHPPKHKSADLDAAQSALEKLAMEHDSPEALKKYLKEHPNADRSKHTIKKDDGGGEGKKDEGGGSKQVSMSREGYKAISEALAGFEGKGSWTHVISYANSGKPMDGEHVKDVIKDIDFYLKNWKEVSETNRWSPQDKKNLTRAKGILENWSGSGKKATWEEGHKTKDDPRDHDGEGSMIPGLHERKAGWSYGEDDAYFSFVGNKTPFNRDTIEAIQNLEIKFKDDEGDTHEDTAIKVMQTLYSPILSRGQEMQGWLREAVVQVRFPEGAKDQVVKGMKNLGKILKFQVEVLPGFRKPESVQGPAPKKPAGKPFPFRGAGEEEGDEKEGKFEEGKPADPTENMSPEDAAEWKKQNEEHKDQFKGASLEDLWGAVVVAADEDEEPAEEDDDEGTGKTAALAPTGLYGFTKSIQSCCEGSIRKLTRAAAKIAKAAYKRDENVAPFLAAHAKRAGSLPAKVLVAAMKDLGPKVASDMRLAELRVAKDVGKPIDKVAARQYGLYGFAAKTATLGLTACTQIRESVGVTASEMHGRKASDHNLITSFLKEHSKQARCMYARMLHESYPDPDRKTASLAPKSVNDWLVWED